ncbi:hypothetical protein DVH05_020371 [Phytophthora capsici]|nr:hypothetical protein DVH05_020371 [Phytophthora capsici]
MMNALAQFEEIVKDGVAPFVGREQSGVGPHSQILSLRKPSGDSRRGSLMDKQRSTQRAESQRVPEVRPDSGDVPELRNVPTSTASVPVDTCPSVSVPADTCPSANVPVDTCPSVSVSADTCPSANVTTDISLPSPSATETTKICSSLSKRQHISSSSSESSGSFIVSKSARNRGRPKVRKNQGKAAKRQRVDQGKQTATKLVQGTLAPVPSVRNIAKLLDADYNYEDTHHVLLALTIREVPKTKKAIAGIYTTAECNNDVRFVFPLSFVEKSQAAILNFRKSIVGGCADDGIGVRVPRFGVFHHKDIVAMNRWHTSMQYMSETEEATNWAVNTSIKRLTIPEKLLDGVSSDPEERERAIKRLPLRGGRSTAFGCVPYCSLLSFRGTNWMDDSCMGHGIALLQREHHNVGIVNPIFTRFELREEQLKAIKAGNPFLQTNKIVLIPLHVANSHCCGAIFDFRNESRGITVFDPLQDRKSKYYDECEETIKTLFKDLCTILPIKREKRSKQPDMSSCGVAVLMFFECFLSEVELPSKPSPACLRFLRLRYMLKCLP